MLSHDFTTKLTHINVSTLVKKKKQFSYNFTKKIYTINFQVCSAEKKAFLCFFPSNCTTTQISAVSLVPAFWDVIRRRTMLWSPNDKYLPCNRFSVSQNFCNSWKYLSRMYTFDMPATFCWDEEDDVSITLSSSVFTNFFLFEIGLFAFFSDFSSTCFTTVSSHTTVVLSWFTYKLSCRAVVVEGRDGPVLSTYYTPLAARALRSHWAK